MAAIRDSPRASFPSVEGTTRSRRAEALALSSVRFGWIPAFRLWARRRAVGHWCSVPCDAFLRCIDLALGAVLVLAGALKGHQLWTNPLAGLDTAFPRWLLIGAAVFEVVFGLWLLTGLYRHPTRWLALAWFTSLAAVALAQAVGGAASCACLGDLDTQPWCMFVFDVVAVAALWTWTPNGHFSRWRLPGTLSLLAAAALFGSVGAPPDQSLSAEIELGDIAQGGHKQQAFLCRNETADFVEVATIDTSCPCASIHLEQARVPEGQFLAGNVTLDLQSSPDFLGDLAIEARGWTARGQVAFRLMIRARVRPASKAAVGTL